MSTKSREVIWGSKMMGAKIRAQDARKRAQEAAPEADRAEAEAWSVRMEGYDQPAVSDHRPMPLRWDGLVGGGVCPVQDPREPSPRCDQTTSGYSNLEAGGVAEMPWRYAPPVRMIKLTETREITRYKRGMFFEIIDWSEDQGH